MDADAFLVVNEAFLRYSKHRGDAEEGEQYKARLVGVIDEWLGMAILGIDAAFRQGETALLHNVMWLTVQAGVCEADCTRLWRRALRWPHSAVKAEPFLVQHALVLHGKGHHAVLDSLVQAVRSVPALRASMRDALCPSSLQSNGRATSSVLIHNDSSDWFYGPFRKDSSPGDGAAIASVGALRAIILFRSSDAGLFDPAVVLVNHLCEHQYADYDGLSAADKQQLVQVALEWTLSVSLPRQYISKGWHVVHKLLGLFPRGHFACDLLLPSICRHMERLVKRVVTQNIDALVCLTECLLLMACSDQGGYLECVLRACEVASRHDDVRVIKLVCKQLLLHQRDAIDDRTVQAIAPGLFSSDAEAPQLVHEVIKRGHSELAQSAPWPLDDESALLRAIGHPFWTNILVSYIQRHRSVGIICALSNAASLSPHELCKLVHAVVDSVVDGEVDVQCFDKLLSCEIRGD